jgi:hypothetical protein
MRKLASSGMALLVGAAVLAGCGNVRPGEVRSGTPASASASASPSPAAVKPSPVAPPAGAEAFVGRWTWKWKGADYSGRGTIRIRENANGTFTIRDKGLTISEQGGQGWDDLVRAKCVQKPDGTLVLLVAGGGRRPGSLVARLINSREIVVSTPHRLCHKMNPAE